jgi:transposase-like protein
LARWKRELAHKCEHAFPGKGHPENEELARLRREVDVLRQELDILKCSSKDLI